MKKFGFLAAFFVVITAFTMAHAENRAGATSFSATVGGYAFENNQDYKNTGAFGVRAGYNFTENWGTELYYNYVPSKYDDTNADNDVYVAGVEALYHFMPYPQIVPFLAAGVGVIHYSSDDRKLVPSKATVDYGAGLKLFLNDYIALRADVRHILPLGESGKYGDNPSKIHNDFMATFGLMITYGGQKTTPEPVAPAKIKADTPPAPVAVEVDKVTDSDRDGVPDYLDACPGTPASVVVDRHGCPPDTDGDGVPDYLDQCPDTPRGVPVDKYGCPKISSTDSDRDGVPDYLDKCPGTPYGVAVDKDGCPVPEKEPLSMRLKLEFAPGKSAIKRMYHSELKTVADFLKAHPGATATIVGHTDDVGNRETNIRLSRARADSVKLYLVTRFGIQGYRIKTMGYGPDKPIASNKTKEGRQANRRVIAYFETAP